MFSESRYIDSAPTSQKTQLYCWLALTAQKTSHAAAIVAWRLTVADMCLPLRCVAISKAGRGAATLSTVACVTHQRTINTRTSVAACVFEGSAFQQLSNGANKPQYLLGL
jgi:hypothetical protein